MTADPLDRTGAIGRFRELLDGPVFQLGIIVPDLERSLATYSELFGLGPWIGWLYGPSTVPELGYRMQPGSYEMRLAITGDSPQFELIEPVAGPSIYHEWLASHGEGLHHVGVRVRSVAAAVETMAGAGCEVVQSGSGYGHDGDGAYAYFDTTEWLGILLEAIELPARRRSPDLTWPPAQAAA